MDETWKKDTSEKDVTNDFLLCNRCGTCRYVCPLLGVYREEWAGARGKVELAEAFFRGEKIDDEEIEKVFDLCLHCMTCEENCPSGMRPDEIIMAVRAEMSRRGLMPRLKRMALWTLGGADRALFAVMRALRLTRRAPLHGVGGKSPLSYLYPMLGWPRERFIPLPATKPFLGSGPEVYRAADIDVAGAFGAGPQSDSAEAADFDSKAGSKQASQAGPQFDSAKAADLVARVARARERNLAAGKRAYFFVGHAVNHFFPEEAAAVTRLLNILGVDVLAPRDQVCCGAPVYYAGDIEGARKAAARMLEKFEGQRYDWIFTTCSTGGHVLKKEVPRLFDLSYDGYFEIGWDADTESFYRKPKQSMTKKEYPRVEDIYKEYVEGKVRDVNELLAELLELREESESISRLFGGAEGLSGVGGAGQAEALDAAESDAARDSGVNEAASNLSSSGTAPNWRPNKVALPIVTYHQPCHLKRGQGVEWQPEAILKMLPGYRYVQMKDFDRCCGGGGAFSFLHAGASAKIAETKMEAVAGVRPDVVATACPLCRIQLMDMLNRRFVLEAKARGERRVVIPVKTPAELLLMDFERLPAR
jgi:Fe-S oxidoreductase